MTGAITPFSFIATKAEYVPLLLLCSAISMLFLPLDLSTPCPLGCILVLILIQHRTGCVVAITRKLQQWNAERILDEYKAYASPKIRDGDVEYISNFQASEIEHLGLMPLAEMPSTHPSQSIRNRCHLYLAAVILILMFISLTNFKHKPDSIVRRNPSLGS